MKIKTDKETIEKICLGYRHDFHLMRTGNKMNLKTRVESIVIAINTAGLHNVVTCETCGDTGGHYEDVAGDGGSHMWMECEECWGVTSCS